MINNAYVKVVSWNINGTGNLVKRKKVQIISNKNNKKKTHSRDKEVKIFERDWVGQVYYSSFARKHNGVIILVNKRLNFSILKESWHLFLD